MYDDKYLLERCLVGVVLAIDLHLAWDHLMADTLGTVLENTFALLS